jgi:hypothetical protein
LLYDLAPPPPGRQATHRKTKKERQVTGEGGRG